MPLDGMRMKVDYSALSNPCTNLGVGGPSQDFQENAVAVFLDRTGRLCLFGISLILCPPNPAIMTFPSLLGRNVIDRWRLTYEPTSSLLEGDPLNAEAFVPVDLSAIDPSGLFNVPNRPE
jgi:hypothetical protein